MEHPVIIKPYSALGVMSYFNVFESINLFFANNVSQLATPETNEILKYFYIFMQSDTHADNVNTTNIVFYFEEMIVLVPPYIHHNVPLK